MSAPDDRIEDLPVDDGDGVKGGSLAPEELKELGREVDDLRADPVGEATEKAGQITPPM